MSTTQQLLEAVAETIRKGSVDPRDDIERERARATFNVRELAEHMHSKTGLERQKLIIDAVQRDPRFRRDDLCFLSRTEQYRRAMTMALAIPQLVKSLRLSDKEERFLALTLDTALPTNLHVSMFVNTIENQGTDEQKAYWLPKVHNYEIIGTYAQTELGHGTFIRGLETFAIYDKSTQEFVFHTPTDSGIKWWPGGLGKTSTHCVLMARLFIDGKDLGPHAFVIQLRTLDTHVPLPGVELGDIGPKLGYTTIDNGYLRLTNYRSPRESMLMRFASISTDGKYTSPPVAKANYATMVFIRAYIVIEAGLFLAKAVTIATRYSAVRRQGDKVGHRETQVLDFQTQQWLLFTLLATSYALSFTGEYMHTVYYDFINARDSKGDFSTLPELHATSSGLKSLCTYLTADGIEVCRKACGGHGYHAFSGFPQLENDYVPNATYEGENVVMALQAARYLIKAVMDGARGKPLEGNARYLGNLERLASEHWMVHAETDVLKGDNLVAAFAHRSARMFAAIAQKMGERTQKGDDFKTAFDQFTVDLLQASKAHCTYILVLNFVQGVDKLPANASFKPVLSALCSLFALFEMEKSMGDFLEDGYVSARQASFVRSQSRSLLKLIRPNAVALVDAFNFSDYSLNSSLGRYDGDVYRDMYRRAQLEPLNATPEGPAWDILKTVVPHGLANAATGRPIAKL